MDEDGYLFVPGLVAPEAIRGVRHDILALCSQAGWLAPGADPDEGIAAPDIRYVAGQPEFMPVYTEIQKLESFHALAHQPGIVEAVRTLVQQDVLVHPRNIARVIFPQNVAYTTPAHQDFIHIKGTPDTYTCWFPLGGCPVEMGGLAVLAGSHKAGIFHHEPALGAGGRGIPIDPLPDLWKANPFRAGDALFFHSHLVHSGLDNRTSNLLRLSVDFRYQGVSQPVAKGSLEPHHGTLSWDEIYVGWKSTRYQRYWAEMSLRVE